MTKIKAILGTVKYTLKKYSPEILLGVGVVGMGVSTVLACKATLRVEEILDTYEGTMEKISAILDNCGTGALEDVEYTDMDAKKDRITVKTQTIIQFVKVYGPSVTLMGASVGCILGAHHIMSKRNVALMAAYKVVEEAFGKYRSRVIKELGSEKDAHFMYGTNTITGEESVIDGDGNKVQNAVEREELVPGAELSGFARMFKEENPDQHGSWTGSTQWSPIHDYNLSFLNNKERYFNDKLVVKGFVTVNEVYEEIGFPPTEAGMICGWRYKSKRGDGYISFAPRGIDGNWVMGTDGDPIVIDLNIDGVIFDQDFARKELTLG